MKNEPGTIRNEGPDREPIEEDNIFILDDEPSGSDSGVSASPPPAWKIMMVDDDQNVHDSINLVLRNTVILNRPISIVHCHSGVEAFDRIQTEKDTAVILLDVVMESPDAGLRLAKKLREEGFDEVRIVLSTGQPGYAPELTVISDYDINDYVIKSDLSRTKLMSVLTTAIRSYNQLHAVNQSQKGLELIIKSTQALYKRKNLGMFASGVLTQLLGMVSAIEASGFVAIAIQELDPDQYPIVAGSGRFEDSVGQTLSGLKEPDMHATFIRASADSLGMTVEPCLGLYFRATQGQMLFVYIDTQMEVSDYYISLLKVFSGNIAVGFENIALIEQLDRLAYVDPILPIPNVNAFHVEFGKFTGEGKKTTHIRVHLNHLGQYISAFGTHVVDRALLALTDRIEDALTGHDHFFGYAGNSEFLFLIDSSLSTDKVLSFFEAGITVDDIELQISTTASIVEIAPSVESSQVLRQGISAMVEARATPNKKVLKFSEKMSVQAAEHLKMQTALRDSLNNRDEIQAYLQPKVDCNSRRILGAEALCRWYHEGRFISPGVFIPVAEAGGLSVMITERMLHLIGEYCRSRKDRQLSPIVIALNLSMHDVQTGSFASRLLEQTADLGISPETLEFEVTESVMMENPEYVVQELKTLQEAGFNIAIDDFGTGYSSLSYVERLPLNTLKIDRAFVQNLRLHTARNSLAATAISLAEKMGLTTVAEGIESEEQHNALLSLGCNVGQGYLYGKPLPFHDFDAMYADSRLATG